MIKFDVRPRFNTTAERQLVLGESNNGDRALIGEMAEVGPSTNVFLSLDYEHVVGIFGKRGSGKSHFLGSLLEAIAWRVQDKRFSSVTKPRGAILFDLLNIFQWMGSKAELPLDIQLYHVPRYAPPNTNANELRLRPQDLNAEDWCLLLGIDGLREPMGQVLYEAVAATRSRGLSRLDDLIRTISGFTSRYAPETIRAIVQRLTSYSTLDLFDEHGMPLRQLCREKSASILLFAGVPEDIRSLYVFLILRRVYEERVRASQIEKAQALSAEGAARADTPEALPRMWLFIDEAQNIVPPRNSSYAIDMLVRYVREGRNFGLSLCFTTQQPTAIDIRIMSQLDTMVAFVLTVPADLAAVQNNLKSQTPKDILRQGRALSFQEAIRSLTVGQCMVSNIDAERAIFIRARERLTPHGGFEA